MASVKVFDLASTYADLSKACSMQAYDKVVNLSTKILTKHPMEVKAFQCKVVALIRTEKYEDCLSLIKKFPNLSNHVIYEKAYVEYRLNRVSDASKTLESADHNDINVLELKAQVHYRKEEFEEAYNCLRKVIRNSHDDYGEERLTNLTAIAAAASCFMNTRLDIDVNPELFEGKFNLACYHLGFGDRKTAAKLLEESESSCRSCLAEDPEITEEEINEEMAPVKVQQAYLLQLDEKEELATQMYQSVIRQRTSDSALVAVAANNIVCINKEQNIFDSRKRIKLMSLDGLQHKLFTKQRINILINQALFYWHTHQMDACHAKLRMAMQESRTNHRAILLSVAQLIREKQLDKAIHFLDSSLHPPFDPQHKLEIIFALAQFHLRRATNGQLSTGLPCPQNALAVANLFKQLLPPEILHLPGLVSTRIALFLTACSGENAVYSRTDAMKLVVECIQSALDWYGTPENQVKKSAYNRLLEFCGPFLLQQGEAELAARLCEIQLSELPIDSEKSNNTIRQILVARLVRAYAQFDRAKAEQACQSLNLDSSLSEANVDALETSFLYGTKSVKRLGRTQIANPDKDVTKSKLKDGDVSGTLPPSSVSLNRPLRSRHKKRKIRLPKNYQPGVMPDPDRWLPRRERAHYRGKRRDKRHISSRGPQGQVGGGTEWDATVQSPKPAPKSPRDDGISDSTSKQVTGASRQQQQRKGRRKGR